MVVMMIELNETYEWDAWIENHGTAQMFNKQKDPETKGKYNGTLMTQTNFTRTKYSTSIPSNHYTANGYSKITQNL